MAIKRISNYENQNKNFLSATVGASLLGGLSAVSVRRDIKSEKNDCVSMIRCLDKVYERCKTDLKTSKNRSKEFLDSQEAALGTNKIYGISNAKYNTRRLCKLIADQAPYKIGFFGLIGGLSGYLISSLVQKSSHDE